LVATPDVAALGVADAATPPTYRVEHRRPRRVTVLGQLAHEKPHKRTLDPYLSRLRLAGEDGVVALVDAATGEVVAQRRLTPGVPPRASRYRRPGPAHR
jgi:hypothetical protein